MSKEIATIIEVRFNECDYYQHVNNAMYMVYMDQGITDFFKQTIGVKGADFLFHLVHIEADLKSSATFGDELLITTKVGAIGNSSITFEISIRNNKTEEIIATGKKIGVFLNIKTMEKIPVPDAIKNCE